MYDPWVCPQRVVLYQPGRSLLLQFADWIETHPQYALVCLPPGSGHGLANILDGETPLVINATDRPEEAEVLVRDLISLLKQLLIYVYTERAQHQLEREIRRNGIPYFDGPMTTDQWDAVILQHHHKGRASNESLNESTSGVQRMHISPIEIDPTIFGTRDDL